MRKAIIENGKVINLIEADDNGIRGLQLPWGQELWDCSNLSVNIGDTFTDGRFYRDTEEVIAPYLPPTALEDIMAQLLNLQERVTTLESML